MNASVNPIPDDPAGDDASPVIDVTRGIKPAVQMALVAHAAGRCQFRGCNEFLFEHPLTRADGNFSEKAHIVAFKKRGPRGRDGDRPEDINALSNLMLLCLRDHKHVDDNPAKYPRSELEKQKAEHEARMARLTALAPQMRSTVLTIKARIGGNLVEVGEHEVWQALYPRYPSERRPHVLDLTELGDEKAGAFYALADERIRRLAGELYATGSDLRATGHLSVLGLAPMPLLVLLGSCLSNKVAVDFYQCHRTRPDRFTWYEEGDVVRFMARKLRTGSAAGTSVLLLSLSGRLGLGDVPSTIDPGASVYEITLDGMPPDLGFLRRRDDLQAFRVVYRALLATLRAEYSGRAEMHLLPAAPAPIALACGYDLLPKVDPDLVLYDNIKPHGFIERLKVKNHDRI